MTENGAVSFALVKKSAAAQVRETGASTGLDWGVVSMFTTSTGQILGRHLYSWLAERDGEVIALAAALQRKASNRRSRKGFGLSPRVSAHTCVTRSVAC
ncbi:hypothetical protein GFY24_11155 [Nocardia sp. SYP-A9097]|uniref:hypothetical protein n=1 Tax=Nocardia sp. SYP-A9097 TaxID=2663237 RepID=UPI00129A265E|nr:hypothetical protein [Nocardia sp. SYP-A9097]MRH87996.1 hypothetical protein [Nocardia sp. SYP-A9097]